MMHTAINPNMLAKGAHPRWNKFLRLNDMPVWEYKEHTSRSYNFQVENNATNFEPSDLCTVQ